MGRTASEKALRAKYRGLLPVGPYRDTILKINAAEDNEEARLKEEIERLYDEVQAQKVALQTARQFIEVVTAVGWPPFDENEWAVEPTDDISFLMMWRFGDKEWIYVWAYSTGVEMSLSTESGTHKIIDPAKARDIGVAWAAHFKGTT